MNQETKLRVRHPSVHDGIEKTQGELSSAILCGIPPHHHGIAKFVDILIDDTIQLGFNHCRNTDDHAIVFKGALATDSDDSIIHYLPFGMCKNTVYNSDNQIAGAESPSM